jgi:hypothetical protein
MLDYIKSPEDLRGYDAGDLRQIADDLRSVAVTAAMPSGASLEIFGKASFDNVKSVDVTAGASAPEVLVGGVNWLRRLGPVEVSTLNGPDETIEFRLPPELASVSSLPRLPTALARPLSQG